LNKSVFKVRLSYPIILSYYVASLFLVLCNTFPISNNLS
jgi:hypothetical protein